MPATYIGVVGIVAMKEIYGGQCLKIQGDSALISMNPPVFTTSKHLAGLIFQIFFKLSVKFVDYSQL